MSGFNFGGIGVFIGGFMFGIVKMVIIIFVIGFFFFIFGIGGFNFGVFF